jgi:putative ABC transport system permease protein
MFRNFFLTGFRSLLKNKGYTILNMAGLAAGLICFAFIAAWVTDELSYDRFNAKAERIVRVAGKVTTETESFDHAVTSVPMASALKQDFPEVENTVRIDKNDAIAVRNGTKHFVEDKILLTDPSFFDVFSYKLSEGDVKTALNAPYNIILTESMAKKYFGNDDPVGKSLMILLYDSTRAGALYKITGVMPDPPSNAHFSFNFLASFKTLEHSEPTSRTAEGWGNNGYYTYLLLKNKNDINALQSKLPAFAERHIGEKMKEWKMKYDFILQPLTSIHLNSNRRYEIEPTGSSQYIFIFGTIGIFILLIAGINYMNLATARSVQRAKEVGVKKVLGAQKGQLVMQYIVEAIIVSMASLLIALLLCRLLQPMMEELTGKTISIFHLKGLLVFLVAIAFLLGLISGTYPAFFLTAYKPINVFKGSTRQTAGAVWLRKALVITQFTISVVLISGILVVNSQLSYIQHKDLGYKKDALLALKVNGSPDVVPKYESFKNSILSTPLVSGVTTSNSLLGAGLGNSGAKTVNGEGKSIVTSIYRLKVDQDYIDVHQMKMIAGRNFSKNIISDTSSYILNEAAVKAFGWGSPENAINKPFSMGGDGGRVVGVVNDFHFNSLQHAVEPLVILPRMPRNGFSQITMLIDMNKPAEAIKLIEENWKKYFPAYDLEYSFLDKKLQEQYRSEERFGKFFLYFSVLSLMIACLGLFGLTAYATQQRTKEIGVRKVLGASVRGIVTMISKDFLRLVLIAAIIAFPLAWWVMNKWLNDFAYRVHIGWWVFVIAGSIALLIALFTVSFQAIKAAIVNPMKSLRTE